MQDGPGALKPWRPHAFPIFDELAGPVNGVGPAGEGNRCLGYGTPVSTAGRDEPHVEVCQVGLRFGAREVFRDLNCEFPRGGISIVMGGSGSGKSTLLRTIGGLQRPDSGQVTVAGDAVTGGSQAEVYRARRRLGMLFQNGALLDSMTVRDNVALPLREHTHRSEEDIEEMVRRRLASVGLEGVEDLLPGELSGGMLRRAALARAIIMDPQIVLCDEPFSGLDPPNVARIEALLVSLNRERGLTLIVSSHHIASSLRMADQLVLLQDGVAISGSPDRLAQSANPRISDFLGPDGRAHAARLGEAGGSP